MGEPATHLPSASDAAPVDDLAAQIEALLAGGEIEAALAAPASKPEPKAHAPASPKVDAASGASALHDAESLTQEELGAAVELMLNSAVAKVGQIQAEADAMVEVAAREALAAAQAMNSPEPAQATVDADVPSAADQTEPQVAEAAPSASLEDELTALAEQLSAEFMDRGAKSSDAAPPVAPPADAAPAGEPAPAAENVQTRAEPVKSEAPAEPATSEPSAMHAHPAAPNEPVRGATAVEPHTPPVVQAAAVAAASVRASDADVVAASAPPESIPPAPVAPKTPRKPIGPVIRAMLGKALKPMANAAGAAGALLGKPLSMQKPLIRDSAGWIAVVTIFMAGCMWAAVLLRDPKPYVPAISPMTLVEEGAGEHGGGGGGGGGHGGGEKKAAAGGHGEKKPAAGHGEAAKGGGGHGAAAAAPVKRDWLIQRGSAAKKAPAKPAAGGGGH